MVSGVASAYWIRWMLVHAHDDQDIIYIARGAPRRWYAAGNGGWGITRAPTRFGLVSFRLQGWGLGVRVWVSGFRA